MRRLWIWVLFWMGVTSPLAVRAEEPAATPKRMKPALLVIDVQKDFLPYMSEQDRKMAPMMINGAIYLFRQHGFPVIRVYHTDPKWGPKTDSEGFQFDESIQVTPEDPQVIKNYPSSFKKTDLEKILRDRGCDTVFICGLSAVGCVLYTWFDAQALDFRAFMIKDALISHRPDLTRSVQEITEAVGLDAVVYMLDSQAK